MSKGMHPAGFAYEFSAFVQAICRPGTGAAACRFLVGDIVDGAGLHCAKFEPELAARINERVETGMFVARGDNCPGKPYGANL